MTDVVFSGLLVQRATVIHRGETGRGAYNKQVIGETIRDEDVPCRLVQIDSTEVVVGEDTVVVNQQVSFEADQALAPIDQVEIDGVTYDVVGQPRVDYDERAPHHIVAHLKAAS